MKTNRSGRGFTLIETLIILAIMMVLAVFTLPEFFAIMNRAKLEGTARQTVTLMRAARLEAIKQSCYGVVMPEPANDRVIAFVDNDRDGLYEPANVPPERLIGRIDLPVRVTVSAEDLLNEPDVPVLLPDGQVMYQQDGSVLAKKGALRFEDEKGNRLKVNLETQTTGKFEVRKFQDGAWITNGEGGEAWKFIK